MSDEKALLAAIRDRPEEDTPRLMYADWLDEHATNEAQRARAEFIRVQIELNRLPPFWICAVADNRATELHDREKQLLASYRNLWLRPTWSPTKGFKSDGITFRRGFPEEGFFRSDEIRDYPDDIHAYPLLRWLRISAFSQYSFDKLFRLSWLGEVRGLELIVHREPFGPPDWAQLGERAVFGLLESLELGSEAPLGHTAAERIAMNATLANVQTLRFWEAPGTDALNAMLRGVAFHSLKVLSVRNRPGEDSTNAPLPGVAWNSRCERLESLSLNEYAVSSGDIESLSNSNCWGSLRELDLGGGRITSEALCEFGSAPCGRLESLSLGRSEITGFRGFRGPFLETVRKLDLSANHHLAAEGIRELAACPELSGLRYLDLSDCYAVEDEGAKIIAASPTFAEVRYLDLINAEIGATGGLALANSPYLGNMIRLMLHGCHLDAFAQAALRERFGDRVHW